MSSDILPTVGRIALTQKAVASKFLFAISRGQTSWDSLWTSPNPPSPPLESTDVQALIGYARPTIVDYLEPDDGGSIVAPGGARYSVSSDPTRYARIRLSLPVGSFSGETVREIGMFIDPVIDAGVPSGQVVIPADKVTSVGRLFQLHWREPLPLEDGDFFARNFVVRL